MSVRLLIISLLSVLFVCTSSFSQEKNHTNSEDVLGIVKNDLKEIYGKSYATYFKKKEQLNFYINLYKRIEYIPLKDAPSGIKNLSGLQLKAKYNPRAIVHDNLTQFDSTTFNPLKYFFNYTAKKDQYFKIYNTNWVMKINGTP